MTKIHLATFSLLGVLKKYDIQADLAMQIDADNSRQHSAQIVADAHQAKANKLRQKDVDARWTKKGSKNYYGYKNHIAADRETKFIVDSCVTPASTHDSQMLFEVLSEDTAGDRQVWADSAYRCEEAIQQLRQSGYKPRSITNAPVRNQ